MRILSAITLSACLLGFGATFASAQTAQEQTPNQAIKLSGSDLLRPVIEKKLAELCAKNNTDVKINMRGTYLALEDFQKGACDIAIISVPEGRKLPENVRAIPFAFQTAVVVVNTTNPIEEISTAQLARIFASETASRAENWQQLGVKNIGLRNIMPAVIDRPDSVVLELFKYSAFNGSNLGAWVASFAKPEEVFNMIRANNAAVGIVGKLPEQKMLKSISVSKTVAGQKTYAFRPDMENIYNGDYPMVLPFYIIYKPQDNAKVRKLVKILLDNDISKLIDASEFVSVPEKIRKKSIFELDLLPQ